MIFRDLIDVQLDKIIAFGDHGGLWTTGTVNAKCPGHQKTIAGHWEEFKETFKDWKKGKLWRVCIAFDLCKHASYSECKECEEFADLR